jgi:aspartate/methionine/tyrosine aminotransferase
VEALRDWRVANRDLMAGRAEAFRRAAAQLPGWRLDSLGAYFAYLRLPEDAPEAVSLAETLAVERGLLGLPGPFFGPGQERHLRLAFANAEESVIAQVPARLVA